MWLRLLNYLACPSCGADLTPQVFGDATDNSATPADTWVDWGVLICERCKVLYPVADGLPVMMTYATPAAKLIRERFPDEIKKLTSSYKFPTGTPEQGEEFVAHSFSREWLEYDYDGVMWDLSYDDHEKRFVAECGGEALQNAHRKVFVEIGCGLGMSTFFGQKHTQGDSIGVDLGQAAWRASKEFHTNRHLHFVQASAFHLPFRSGTADLVYSHGVLHHTYSTEKAVRAVAGICRPGGTFYVWLYGPDSRAGSPLRRIAYALEVALRPGIARRLDAPTSKAFLGLAALGYVVVNRYHWLRDRTVETYSFRRALHAARDRFTPLFAHRHSFSEVAGWLRQEGFDAVEQVDWRTMPTANQDNYRRNTGVRGRRVETT